ncbi:hypothetical protein K458DRAFT_385711 [Lentithecium fluviatile CBS 122367]|uniref:F-box domain-containing protein n=1 Tax=Lentithecium fluviatile CBS 122367 TaxID=1168545 RepID=A0A6G1JD46_9PLEO|nr:hypothetical protein K458DRAFT_385711 [Lentithecium fluviatile CBS 122367]
MDADIFCVLCGGPFDLEPGVHNIDPSKNIFHWLYNVRLLGTPSALRNHRMSTAGEIHLNLSDSPDVFLSETARWTATDADCLRLGDSFYNVLVDDEAGDVLFPLHHACIQIGCRALRLCDPDHSDQPGSSALASLYYALRRQNQRAKSSGKGLKHDIFALYTSSKSYGPRSILALDELGWWSGAYEKFLADPLDTLGLTTSIFNLLQPISIGSQSTPQIAMPHLKLRGLEALPSELFEKITEPLSPRSILSLRQASRTMALNIPLDDRFWRRHICSGALLPYIWDLDEENLKKLLQHAPSKLPWNWQSLVYTLRTEGCLKWGQAYGEVPDGLWNRYRIWNVIRGASVRPEAEASPPFTTTSRNYTNNQTGTKLRTQALCLGLVVILLAFLERMICGMWVNSSCPRMTR